jgi:hypothetical protein
MLTKFPSRVMELGPYTRAMNCFFDAALLCFSSMAPTRLGKSATPLHIPSKIRYMFCLEKMLYYCGRSIQAGCHNAREYQPEPLVFE